MKHVTSTARLRHLAMAVAGVAMASSAAFAQEYKLHYKVNGMVPPPAWTAHSPLLGDWVDVGSRYGCTNWSPAANTQPEGESFTQTATDCQQEQERTVQQREFDQRTGTVRIVGEPTTESRTITASDSREAVGTMPQTAFTTHTFSNCGKTGYAGPALSQCQSAYAGAEILKAEYAFNVNAGVQRWKVPATGTYRITVEGAQGGPGNTGNPGLGAVVRGDFSLSAGTMLNILVGQQGLADGESGGGGGGSFVWISSGAGPLLAAGGGGAPGDSTQVSTCSVNGRNGNLGTAGSADGCNAYGGGTNGSGGSSGKAGAGAGWTGNGGGGSLGGKAITSSAQGGTTTVDGGFGGGGADGSAGADGEGGGAGGGYSGGGASNGTRDAAGGGGGSFIAASVRNPATSNGSWSATGSEPHAAYRGSVQSLGRWGAGHGSVTIQLLK